MPAVARELNNSETAFVLRADGADHDVRVRFFTPTTEVPTCGHATIATHFARAIELDLPTCSLIQETGTGLLQRIHVHRDRGQAPRIGMNQGIAEFGGRTFRGAGGPAGSRARCAAGRSRGRSGADRLHGAFESTGRFQDP
ncbi:PhzF family phenazine biosynthesis protein [Streptomyces sp. NBC_00841]|nr:PhzF family phenazine biosynthesis protein [Streptomyces sp. NBC_00841]